MEQQRFSIEQLERKIKELNSGAQKTPQSEVWRRFNDLIARMSDDQRAYVGTNENVIKKRKDMMNVFNDWMFERFKDDFVAVPEFDKLAQEYVGAVASTSQEYAQKAAGLQEENERLKAEIEKLKANQATTSEAML